ncbi:MAG TPA: hypothetical protein VHE30_29060, partial [Polyangiaceae bacterium]|nr:hypothetical protein [Polyangiaceae bacterium]
MIASAPDGVKITVQYRTKEGKIYELTNKQTVLALHISAPDGHADRDTWHVEARLGTGTGPALVDGWGSTAAEALRETGRAWALREPGVFDW